MGRQKKLPAESLFSKNLVEVLKSRNISQSQAAKLAGVSLSTLNGWTAGAAPSDMKAILRLCKSLDLDFQYLLSGERSGLALSKIPIEELFKVEESASFDGFYQVSFKKMVRK